MHNSTCVSGRMWWSAGAILAIRASTVSLRLPEAYAAESEVGGGEMDLEFDFKVRFFHEMDTQLPLVYLTAGGDHILLFEVTVHRHCG